MTDTYRQHLSEAKKWIGRAQRRVMDTNPEVWRFLNVTLEELGDMEEGLTECCDDWISVEERLPESGQRCWMAMWDGGNVRQANFVNPDQNNSWYFIDRQGTYKNRVTHWQPLDIPAPPKKEE